MIVDKSKAFALKVIALYKKLCDTNREFVMSKQLLKSGTSIGANIKEAQQGQSKADFGNRGICPLRAPYQKFLPVVLLCRYHNRIYLLICLNSPLLQKCKASTPPLCKKHFRSGTDGDGSIQ
ncbi:MULTISPECIES: four helix bundle protein [unclassified Treponema]|uniref:four helix bundle protein n=1 Tax=unclassified Treponema TaxID=2638727 RepID=UPI001F489D12|nr:MULTISPECIES: four helix bundle protein [unclassified Treponema]